MSLPLAIFFLTPVARINACDREEKFTALRAEFYGRHTGSESLRSLTVEGCENINILPNGHLVSRESDYIIYSVEAEHIDEVVATYGPCKGNPSW